MKVQKTLVALAVATVIGTTGAVYTVTNVHADAPSTASATIADEAVPAPFRDTNTYYNRDLGISFKYPTTWGTITETDDPVTGTKNFQAGPLSFRADQRGNEQLPAGDNPLNLLSWGFAANKSVPATGVYTSNAPTDPAPVLNEGISEFDIVPLIAANTDTPIDPNKVALIRTGLGTGDYSQQLIVTGLINLHGTGPTSYGGVGFWYSTGKDSSPIQNNTDLKLVLRTVKYVE